MEFKLKDKLTGIITNLSEANYTYSATPGASNDRFEIIYKPQTTLSSSANKEQGVSVYRSGENFVVKASNTKISGIEVFDSIGRLIINKKVNAMEATIHRRDLTNGVFILKISQDDKTTVKKIVN